MKKKKDQIESKELFLPFGRVVEIFTALALVTSLLLIQLPLEPKPERTVIYALIFFGALANFLWVRVVRLPLSKITSNFLQSFFSLFLIFLIIQASGGVNSYFNILYILPNLSVAFFGSASFMLVMFGATSILIFAQATIAGATYGLSAIFAWSLILIVLYGRFMTGKLVAIRQKTEGQKIEKLKNISQLKDEFVYVVSHELRAPITAIRGYLDLMLTGGNLTGEQEAAAREAFQKSEILKNLIDDLLDISRIERGVLQLNNERIDLPSFIQDLAKSLQAIFKSKNIELKIETPDGQFEIFADRQRLGEVVKNLLDAQAKITPAFGQVKISWRKKGIQIWIEVGGSSHDLKADEVSHLFEKFYQPEGKENLGGLELFAAKKLLEKMGGEIWAKTTPQGLVFTSSLPLRSLETVEI